MSLNRVLHINAVSGIKSTGRMCVEMAEYMNANNIQTHIAHYSGSKYAKSYKISNFFDHKLHGLLARLTGLQGYYSIYSTRKLIAYIKKIKPQIVHLHNIHEGFLNTNMLLSYLAKNDIPTVITLHDCWFYTGRCCHYIQENCDGWKYKCNKCKYLKSYYPSWFFDFAGKMYRDKELRLNRIHRLAVIGVSDWITSDAKESLLNDAKIIKRIYNWINTDLFNIGNREAIRKKLKLNEKFIILGVASEWNKDKNLQAFYELADVLLDDMIIVLIGTIKNYKSNSKIINIKEINDVSELVKYYNAADVFVSLSKAESFGLVIIEALACGTPVIMTNNSSCHEIVQKKCGYITNSIEEIIYSINKIKKNGRKYYSNECRNFAVKNFNQSKQIEEYLKVYNKLLSKKHK